MQDLIEKGKPLDMMGQFKKYVHDCPNIIPIQGSTSTAAWPDGSYADLVYIDADHTSPNVDLDIDCWFERLKPKGVLCGHDFNPYKYPDVVRAVLRKSKDNGIPFKLFGKGLIWAIELDPYLYPAQGWVPDENVMKMILEELRPQTDYKSDWIY
jgi:hypothetical protein